VWTCATCSLEVLAKRLTEGGGARGEPEAELRVVGAHDRVDRPVLELGGQLQRHLHDRAPRSQLAGEPLDFGALLSGQRQRLPALELALVHLHPFEVLAARRARRPGAAGSSAGRPARRVSTESIGSASTVSI
jgi:hypothetical protein